MRNDGLFTDCEVDSDCDDVEGEGVGEDLKCGALFGMDALNGGVTEEVCMKYICASVEVHVHGHEGFELLLLWWQQTRHGVVSMPRNETIYTCYYLHFPSTVVILQTRTRVYRKGAEVVVGPVFGRKERATKAGALTKNTRRLPTLAELQATSPPLVPPTRDVEKCSRIATIVKGSRAGTRALSSPPLSISLSSPPPLPSPTRHGILQIFAKKCGSSLGWHSANKICGNSKGKPLG